MREKTQKRIGILLLILAAALFIGTAVRAGIERQPEKTLFTADDRPELTYRAELPDGWLSVNDAETEDLIQLKGIGETIAANLISEREKNGSFYYPEDLLAVKGIGAAKLEQIRDELNFSPPEKEEIGE